MNRRHDENNDAREAHRSLEQPNLGQRPGPFHRSLPMRTRPGVLWCILPRGNQVRLGGAKVESAVTTFRNREVSGAFEVDELAIPLFHFHDAPSPDEGSQCLRRARSHVTSRDLLLSEPP